MNLLLVAHERNLGGASRSLLTLAEELQAHGNRITVVVPIKSGQVYRELRKKQIPVRRIFFGWWMMPADWNPLFKVAFRLLYRMQGIPAARIAALAKKCNAQIIHSNSSAIDVGAMAAQKAGLPHVWHFREFGDLDYRLQFLKGRALSCRYVAKVPGCAVFISECLRRYYEKELPAEKCRVIYNGISEHFLIDKWGAEKVDSGISAAGDEAGVRGETIFLIAGNLHRNKRQDLAISACALLYERGFRDFRLRIAGAASAMADSVNYEKELRAQADGLPGIVELLGYQSDMKSVREKADVELVCSDSEAFGRVTVEAMMASNPVIASNSGANPELIEDGINGLLFETGNAAALADCMQAFLEDRAKIRQMGAAAFAYAKERFPSSVNTARMEELYQSLIG